MVFPFAYCRLMIITVNKMSCWLLLLSVLFALGACKESDFEAVFDDCCDFQAEAKQGDSGSGSAVNVAVRKTFSTFL